MIYKNKPQDKKVFEYGVIDIETDEKGKPTDFGLYDGQAFYHYTDLELFTDFLLAKKGRYYAHVGMGFDFPILVQSLIKKEFFEISFSNTQGIALFSENLSLLDSYRLLPSSLKKLCASFDPSDKKIDLQEKMPWELTEETRVEYLKNDCLSLYQIITKFWNLIDSYFGKYRAVTLPSLSLKIWRGYIVHQIPVTQSKRQLNFEADSYYGGICWLNDDYKGKQVQVKIYDVNSMYPYNMLGLFPRSYRGYFTRKFNRKSVGLWQCKVKYSGIPFTFDYKKRKLTNDGEFILDTDTINYLLENKIQVKIEIGYIYEVTDYIFKEFIEKAYQLRKDPSNEALSYIAKILMNSLYGKFAEKIEKRFITNKYPEKYKKLRIYDLGDLEIFDYTQDSEVRHRFVAISSLITLRARLQLKKLSNERTIYCDTDSLHNISKDDEDDYILNSELGGIKLEYKGKATYIGKKIYQTETSIKCKGIPQNSLRFIDLSTFDKSLEIDYNSFTSLIDVLKGKPFELIAKKRTING